MRTLSKIIASVLWVALTLALVFIGSLTVVAAAIIGGIIFTSFKFFWEVCVYAGDMINEAILCGAVMVYNVWRKDIEEIEELEELGEEFSVKRA